MTDFKITKGEWIFILVMVILPFIFDSKKFIVWLDKLNPIFNFLIYYVIIFSVIFLLSKAGLTIWKFHIKSFRQVIGAGLVTFSFFLIFNWENPFVQYYSTGSFLGASNVFYGTEDGISFFVWRNLFPVLNSNILWYLVFPLTILILMIIGVWLVNKPEIKA